MPTQWEHPFVQTFMSFTFMTTNISSTGSHDIAFFQTAFISSFNALIFPKKQATGTGEVRLFSVNGSHTFE
jgi:hypothetical protein